MDAARLLQKIFTSRAIHPACPVRATKKPPGRRETASGAFWNRSGDTYSRTLGTTIGSESLTTVFGMGTGVAFPTWSPEKSVRPVRGPRAWGLWLKQLSVVSCQLSVVSHREGEN